NIDLRHRIQHIGLQWTSLRECQICQPFGFVQLFLLSEIDHRQIVVHTSVLRGCDQCLAIIGFSLLQRPPINGQVAESDQCRHVPLLLFQGSSVFTCCQFSTTFTSIATPS